MTDDERDLDGLSDAQQELARRLARFSPVIREQERADAELDPAFVRNLRAYLVAREEYAPRPGFARDLRSRLLAESPARPVPKPVHRRLVVWAGASAALLALLVAALVLLLVPHRSLPSITAPYPTRADLVFSFPAPPTVVRRLTPTLSLVHPRPGVPYAGHLRLSAPRLATGSKPLRAYLLEAPSNVAATGRHLLGIHSPVRRLVVGGARWMVAADGGPPSHRPLHSLAVSLSTGELIYHDRRNLALPRATKPLSAPAAVRLARRWLTRLGWPGDRMPLVEVESVPHLEKVREVELGWPGVGRTATDAATLWVTPNRSVVEAWVWPPVVRSGFIAARSLAAAWTEVRAGRLPLAVEGVPAATRSNGAGSVRDTAVVAVLSRGRAGGLYLVPTYRFEGKAHVPGASVHTWYSLAPSAQK